MIVASRSSVVVVSVSRHSVSLSESIGRMSISSVTSVSVVMSLSVLSVGLIVVRWWHRRGSGDVLI